MFLPKKRVTDAEQPCVHCKLEYTQEVATRKEEREAFVYAEGKVRGQG